MRWILGMVALVVVACSSSTSHPPSTGDVGGGDAGLSPSSDIPPASTTGYDTAIGGAVPVSPGTKIGYALTASQPKTYRFRWTGDAAVAANGFQHFYGSVWTTGHFTQIIPGCDNQACPLEPLDMVSAAQPVTGGERIDWDTAASTGWDGFSFTTDAEPIYFDVFIDGARHPELFFYASSPSGTTSSPAVSPFGITSVGVSDGGTSDASSDASNAD